MKKLLLMWLCFCLFITNVSASSGALRNDSIKTCPDGIQYGQHGSDNHWHIAEYTPRDKGSNYSALGDPIYSDPCSAQVEEKEEPPVVVEPPKETPTTPTKPNKEEKPIVEEKEEEEEQAPEIEEEETIIKEEEETIIEEPLQEENKEEEKEGNDIVDGILGTLILCAGIGGYVVYKKKKNSR